MIRQITTTKKIMIAWLGNINLEDGKDYELIVSDTKRGTGQQNTTFHGLIKEYQPYSSYGSWDDIRESMLIKYGPVKERNIGGRDYIIVPKWGTMSKDYRSKIIGGMISEMLEAGVNGVIFDSLVAEYKASIRGM